MAAHPRLALNSLMLPVEGRMLADVEQQMILASLKKFGGNKTLAATELGVTPRTITNKLKLYRGQNRKAA